MSDENTTTTDTAVTEVASSGKTTDWYESELTKVRAEAAKYRTAKNEAVETVKSELTKEWETKLAAADQEKHELMSSYQKLMAALPKDQREGVVKFASLLQGEDAEALEAHAEEVRSLFGGVTTTPKADAAVDKTPVGSKPLALNDDDGLTAALKTALGITD